MMTSPRNLSLEWGKDNFDLVKNSSSVLGVLADVLRKRLAALESEELSPEHFHKPEVFARQCYISGRKKELTEALKLIKGDHA